MAYLAALVLLAALPFVFVTLYGRRVTRFKGPWIVEQPIGARTGGLVYETEGSQRRLTGLSAEETREFELLDSLSPVDDRGRPIAWDPPVSQPPASQSLTRETRWLELYLKHQQAQKRAAQPQAAFSKQLNHPAA